MISAAEPVTAVPPAASAASVFSADRFIANVSGDALLDGDAAAMYLVGAVTLAVLLAGAAVAAFLLRGPRIANVPSWPKRVASHDEAVSAHDALGDIFYATGFDGKPCVFVRGEHAPRVLTEMGFGDSKWSGLDTAAGAAAFVVPSNLVQPMAVPTFFHDAGATWKKARAALRRLFVPTDASASWTVEATDRAVDMTAPRGASAAEVDAQSLSHIAFRDTMMSIGFGRSAAEAPVVERQFEALEAASGKWRADGTMDHAHSASAAVESASAGALAACASAVLGAIEAAREGDERSAGSMAALLRSALPEYTGEGPDAGADEAARTVFNLIVAGAESNAISSAKTVAAIAENPKLVAELQAEVDAAIAAEGGITNESMKASKVPLLDACVREGLRMFVPATAAQRVCEKETVLGTATIPAGTTMCVCIHALHMDSSVWSNPSTFDHTRFLGGKKLSRPRHAYLPFSCGPRKCPGEAVAVQQARVLIATLLRSFTLRSVEPVSRAHVAGFTEWTGRGVSVGLVPRSA